MLVVVFLSGISNVPIWLGAFSIVLAHELGHCFVSMYFGIQPQSITLCAIGGVARMEVSREPWKELAVAVGGPAVNILLIPALWVFYGVYRLVDLIFAANLVILVFNLIPAIPLDGGRVARSLLSLLTNNRRFSTVFAVRLSQIISVCMCGVGIYYSLPTLAIIFIFIGWAAQGEILMAELCDNVREA